MNRQTIQYVAGYKAADDEPLMVIRRDFSGGSNSRIAEDSIGETQGVILKNIDISVPGKTFKRPGILEIEEIDASENGTGIYGFEPAAVGAGLVIAYDCSSSGKIASWGGSSTFAEIFTSSSVSGAVINNDGADYEEDDILTITGGDGGATVKVLTIDVGGEILTISLETKGCGYAAGADVALTGGAGTGATADITVNAHKITGGYDTTIIKAGESGEGDVMIVANGQDNCYRLTTSYGVQDLGNDNTAPPRTNVLTYFRNRVFALKDNLLYFSDAFPADYSAAFDRAVNYFNVPIGKERAIIGVRDMGLICLGSDSVWGINPSDTPAATDKPEKLIDVGCIAKRTACRVGEDVWFLSPDGLRGVMRTQMDKLQMSSSYPLSYLLKTNFESINWAYIHKACAVYFDNKYFLALPTGTATYNNEVWVFYPSQMIDLGNGIVCPAATVIEGWTVEDWAAVTFSGEKKLYYIDSSKVSVNQAWKGYNDDGTAIEYHEEGRREDLGQPLKKKAGGEVKIKCLPSGDGDQLLSVYAAFDEAGYQRLGIIELPVGTSLPVSLPFYLTPQDIVEEVYHLDPYGEWFTIKLKLVQDGVTTDDVVVLERSIVSFPSEYYNEE